MSKSLHHQNELPGFCRRTERRFDHFRRSQQNLKLVQQSWKQNGLGLANRPHPARIHFSRSTTDLNSVMPRIGTWLVALFALSFWATW